MPPGSCSLLIFNYPGNFATAAGAHAAEHERVRLDFAAIRAEYGLQYPEKTPATRWPATLGP
jgi:hypothetical protein